MRSNLALPTIAAFAAVAFLPANARAADPAPASSDQIVTLPEFTVSSATSDPFRATDSISGGRIRVPMLDAPETIDVLTNEFMQTVGAQSVWDAAQYLPGIGAGRLAGVDGLSDRITIRGFENGGRTIDNFSDGVVANVDPDLIERVEIVQGPNAILAPTGTPGGTVNDLMKVPQMTQNTTISAEAGLFLSNKLTVDSTGPITGIPGLAYRFVAGGQDTEAFVPGREKIWDVNPELSYDFKFGGKLVFIYSHGEWKQFGAAANEGNTFFAPDTAVNGGYVSTTPQPGFSYGDPEGAADWSLRSDRYNRAELTFTTPLVDNITMRAAARYYNEYSNADFTTPSFPSGSNRYDPYTGVYTPDDTWALNAATGMYVPTFSAEYNPMSIAQATTINRAWQGDFQAQNDYSGSWKVGGVTLNPTIGFTYENNPSLSTSRSGPAPAAYDPFAPNLNPPKPPDSAYTYKTKSGGRVARENFYAYLRAGFLDDHLFLTGGASRLWLNSLITNELTWLPAALDGYHDNYLAGVVAKPVQNVSLYYSYSTNANAVSFNAVPLWESGVQDEYGVKTDFFNHRLAVSADHFQISETNVVASNPAFATSPTAPQNILLQETNHGFEYEVQGGLTPDLSIIASYTTMFLRDGFGRRVTNIPDKMADALLQYRFHEGLLRNLSTFFGVTWVGDQAGENPSASATQLGVVEQTSFLVHSRTICNLGANYAWGRYGVGFNVDNVFDQRAIWQDSSRFSLSVYPTTNFRFHTSVSF